MTSPQERASSREGKDSDPAKFDSETLAGEVMTLRRDLWLFRTVYLPVLLRSASPELLERWQATAHQLATALRREGQEPLNPLTPEPVLELLQGGQPEGSLRVMPPADSFVPVGDRLCWHLYPYSGQGAAEREEQVRFVLRWGGAGDERAAAPWLELRKVLPAVQDFFLSLTPASDKKLGGYTAVLPILAELDPAFAIQALDRGRLLAVVESDPGLPPSERWRRCRVLESRFYAGCLCHGLALVLEALANNHFAKIAPLLRLPEVHADAFWAGLMPRILLATLYQKAVLLQEWTLKISPSDEKGATEAHRDDRLP